MDSKMNDIIKRLPNVQKEELYEYFPKLDFSAVETLKDYSWEQWHEGSQGAGDQYLAAEIADILELKPGMRVLELGSGRCVNSCFFAKHYGVNIIAVDLNADPSQNWEVAIDKGVDKNVLPLKCDARQLPFPEDYFDAIICMNAYFYFGTDDLYLPYLSKHLKKGGNICVVSPCYSDEIEEFTPEYMLFDYPNFLESNLIHSPKWWEKHFNKVHNIRVLFCQEHKLGREIWLDSIRWQLQNRDLQDLMRNVEMLLKDDKRFVTYFTLLAQKQ